MAIARRAGWRSGAASSHHVNDAHRPLYFLDAPVHAPRWARHSALARCERPDVVVIPDILTPGQVGRALEQAEEVAPYARALVFIPKMDGIIGRLPRQVGGKEVILGYSVPSRYGSTPLPAFFFRGWPVHLLGGTPLRQLALACAGLQVRSADGNMAQKIARYGAVFLPTGSNAPYGRVYAPVESDLPYAAFACSLENIASLWRSAGYRLQAEDDE
jgi:hypothetical protein